ncbi:Flp family type IVb pilin [Zestomonas thermotolerans]|uniref:Flp family type IVb pilin n=1 Tax=Zestomonas thermotolerans TaxID=157784 RepID=UPI00055E288A|nr:Flp family type IVb pilin [Pseudomonas thermotolerans]
MLEKITSAYCKLRTFLKCEEGASAIEYGIIAGLIAVAIIAGAGLIGDNLETVFDNIANGLLRN